jgi:predicted  nucleic acid-binding Zn-ribbon protein
LTVDNISGIDSQSQTFQPGITLVSGFNASNRSSLLQGLMTALGSKTSTLRTGTDQGRAQLTLGETTATARLTRTSGTTVFEGDPYLGDPRRVRSVELFGWLGRKNPIRTAIRQDGDELRELLLQPVDTDEIDRRLQTIRAEIDALEADYEATAEDAAELPALERECERLADQRAECTATLDELEAQIADHTPDQSARSNYEEIATLQKTLEDVQEDIANANAERARERNRRETLIAERTTVLEELDTLDLPETDEEALAARRAEALVELDAITADIERLEELIAFNREQLAAAVAATTDSDGDGSPTAAESPEASPVDSPVSVDHIADTTDTAARGDHCATQRTTVDADTNTNRQGPDDGEVSRGTQPSDTTAEITCWTCGQAVHRDRIQATLEQLRADKREHTERRDNLEATCEELDRKLATCNEHREQRDRLQTRREELDTKIDRTERTIEDLDTRIAERTDRRADLQARLESLSDPDHYEQLRTLQDTRVEHRAELARIEAELETVEGEIEAATTASDRRGQLESELEATRSERDTLRTRRRDREQAVIDTFNETIERVLDDLAFEDIERIWLERQTGDHDDPSEEDPAFVVHLARTDDEGVVHRTRIATLSDSEREVVGLVLALAGYRAHDIHTIVPVMVLDGVELLDPPRLAALLDVVAEHAEYVIATILADDAHSDPLQSRADATLDLDGATPDRDQPTRPTQSDATGPRTPPTHDRD